ncbi:hypothetical protein MMC20_007722 [Loxospora ochrophaea]|nr:hypothetical protein [Loxospora ochrophaea]
MLGRKSGHPGRDCLYKLARKDENATVPRTLSAADRVPLEIWGIILEYLLPRDVVIPLEAKEREEYQRFQHEAIKPRSPPTVPYYIRTDLVAPIPFASVLRVSKTVQREAARMIYNRNTFTVSSDLLCAFTVDFLPRIGGANTRYLQRLVINYTKEDTLLGSSRINLVSPMLRLNGDLVNLTKITLSPSLFYPPKRGDCYELRDYEDLFIQTLEMVQPDARRRMTIEHNESGEYYLIRYTDDQTVLKGRYKAWHTGSLPSHWWTNALTHSQCTKYEIALRDHPELTCRMWRGNLGRSIHIGDFDRARKAFLLKGE